MGRSFYVLLVLATAALCFCIVNISIGTFHASVTVPHSPPAPLYTSSSSRDPPDRPPLDSILQGKWNITGDPSWLLHFAIIGFPKSGTSTMMHHLSQHPEVSIFHDERCDLAYNQQAVLIKDSYLYLGKNKIRGIKCPMLLESTQLGMRNLQKFFPKTKYIVGIRHPVLWFESFYNFRIQNEYPMPPANELVGKCTKGGYNVCTFRSSFHLFLSNLMLTPMGENELQYIDSDYHNARDPLPAASAAVISTITYSPPRVFLYELSQLTRRDTQGEDDLRYALQSFLGLTKPIEPFIWFKPGVEHKDLNKTKHLNANKINICDKQYDNLRGNLQQQATNVSLWIRNYFMHAPGVSVSNKVQFVNIMESWETNPCLARQTPA